MPTIYSKNKTTGEFERVGLGAINIPTKTSDLTNDSEFVNEDFVNDAISKIPTPDVSGQIDAHNTSEDAHEDIRNAIPTKTSELTNDSGFITGYTETDPTVPAWAKAASKPTYTASEVGARSDTWVPSLSDIGVTATADEINYIDGVTKNIQEQFNSLSNSVEQKVQLIIWGADD